MSLTSPRSSRRVPAEPCASCDELSAPVLAGSGSLMLDGEVVELMPGRYVRVAPSVSRRLSAGPDGVSMVVVGAPIGSGYEPRGPF